MESNSSANIFAVSAVPQANYQTDLAGNTVTKNYRQVEKKDLNFAKFSVQSSTNKGSSTGSTYGTRKKKESQDVSFSLTEDLSSQLLPERAYAGMGLLTSEELVEDLVYKHTIKLLNPQTGAQQPAYGYVEKAGESVSRPNARNNKYPSAVCGQFAVKGSGKATLEATTQWNGSGKKIKPSGIKFYGTGSHVILLEEMLDLDFFINTAAQLKLYSEKQLQGSMFSVGCGFRDFDYMVNQNLQLEAGYLGCGLFQEPGNSKSGAIRGKCEIGDQTVQFNFTMIENDDYDPYDVMQDVESISAELKYEGGAINDEYNHSATFKLNAGNIVDVDHVIIENKNGAKITTEPLAIGQIMPVEIVVINNVPSYQVPSW